MGTLFCYRKSTTSGKLYFSWKFETAKPTEA